MSSGGAEQTPIAQGDTEGIGKEAMLCIVSRIHSLTVVAGARVFLMQTHRDSLSDALVDGHCRPHRAPVFPTDRQMPKRAREIEVESLQAKSRRVVLEFGAVRLLRQLVQRSIITLGQFTQAVLNLARPRLGDRYPDSSDYIGPGGRRVYGGWQGTRRMFFQKWTARSGEREGFSCELGSIAERTRFDNLASGAWRRFASTNYRNSERRYGDVYLLQEGDISVPTLDRQVPGAILGACARRPQP